MLKVEGFPYNPATPAIRTICIHSRDLELAKVDFRINVCQDRERAREKKQLKWILVPLVSFTV